MKSTVGGKREISKKALQQSCMVVTVTRGEGVKNLKILEMSLKNGLKRRERKGSCNHGGKTS